MWSRLLRSRERSPSPAARALFRRIIADERLRTARWLCAIRAALAVVNFAVVFPEDQVAGFVSVWPSRYGALLYMLLALGILLAVELRPSWLRLAPLTPALVDIPLVGAIEWKQALLALQPGAGTPASVAFLLGFVLLGVLTLSRLAIVLATAAALLLTWFILDAAATPLPVRGAVLVVMLGGGGLGWLLVEQVHRLLRLSRQRDLVGKYVLGERIGAGGMAEVFSATYCPEGGFERRVAIKRILPGLAASDETIELFRREAELGARLNHPNVVQVIDFGALSDTYFLAMEYVDGTALSRLLSHHARAGQPLGAAALIYIARELASALAYIHDRTADDGAPQHLVHRDLNPPNILLSRIGEVKLADFGIARVADRPSVTRTGAVRGKLAYAAPEQLLGRALDRRCDLWALGVTLHEAACARRLFAAPSEPEILQRVLEDAVPSLSGLRGDLPRVFVDLVGDLLQRAPERRPPSAEAVLARLAPALHAVDAAQQGREALARAVGEALRAPAEVASREPATVREPVLWGPTQVG
jgi:hypothetical protein